MKEFVKFGISSEVFTDTLNSLTENESVIVNIFRNENGELINGVNLKQLRYWTNFLQLKIPGYDDLNHNFQKVKDPVLKTILKCNCHKKNQRTQNFLFMKLTMKNYKRD